MKLKPIYKTNKNTTWILDYLPEDYENMTYCEPLCNNGSMIFNKSPSSEEIINNLDEKTVNIFRVLRDHPKEVVSRLKKVKCNNKNFLKILSQDKSTDLIDSSIHEFTLRKLSRDGDKTNFGTEKEIVAWNNVIKQIPEISIRLNFVHIINKPTNKVIEVFDGKNTIFFIEAPNTETTPQKLHTDLANCIRKAKGKFLVSSSSPSLYSALYREGWKKIRKKTYQKFDYLWSNYL